jgi:hypothetical protein
VWEELGVLEVWEELGVLEVWGALGVLEVLQARAAEPVQGQPVLGSADMLKVSQLAWGMDRLSRSVLVTVMGLAWELGRVEALEATELRPATALLARDARYGRESCLIPSICLRRFQCKQGSTTVSVRRVPRLYRAPREIKNLSAARSTIKQSLGRWQKGRHWSP